MRKPDWLRRLLVPWIAAGCLGLAPIGTAHAQSSLSPGYAARRRAILALGARRARDLVLRDRLQRSLLHLLLSAAARRRDRLVPHSRAPRTSATCSRPGAPYPIRTAACRAIRTVRRKSLDETYGFQYCPGDEELLKFVGTRGLSRSRLRLQGCAVQHVHAAWQRRSAPERLRSAVRHLDRRARPAQIPQSALRCGEVAQAQRLARHLGRLRQVPVGRQRQRRLRAPTACSTARSSRRSASAWRAAPATSPTIR